MFDFFKKKKDKVRIIDKIWMTETAKWNAVIEQTKKDPNTVFILWFDESLRKVEALGNADLVLARQIQSSQLLNKQVIFGEHYPLRQKELELFAKLNLSEVQVWSALDESLFKQFGSDKIIEMMKQLGMKENEAIEHNMISKAIQNAQEKIGKKVLIDQTSSSQEEWMRKNWPKN